jgi:hypothetical protein
MTGDELATQFRNLVDDDFDTTHLYQLLSQAKNYVERVYKLEICKKLDSSQTASVGDTYTSYKNLPTDFRSLLKIQLDRIPYTPCRFEEQITYRNVARRVFIDMANNRFAPTGPVSNPGTWNIFYIYKTTDFTEANKSSSVCVWPDEFQPLIPYQAAKIFQANIDGDAISFRMSEEQESEYQRMLDALVGWDADLKLSSMDGRTGFHESTLDEETDIGLL